MAKDPYRYFRIEAQELLEGLSTGILHVEKKADTEVVRTLLRQAHTLKGAARVVKRADLGDHAHALEDLLAPYRESGGPLPRSAVDGVLELLDAVARGVASLGAPAERDARSPEPAVDVIDEDRQTIRIAVRDLDVLLDVALEAHHAGSSLREHQHAIGSAEARARDLAERWRRSLRGGALDLAESAELLAHDLGRLQREMQERIERLEAELAELRRTASELRLVPARVLTTDLERAVRDAARTLDKEVEIHFEGADTHVDAYVLAGLRKALVHVVLNAVAHGIEDAAERAGMGKPPVGSVEVSMVRQGHRVAVTCSDDGRGVDLEAVRRRALERGYVTADDAASMDEDAVGELLLRGGVSTSASLTEISGRGVGLDAVRHAIARLDGEVRLRTQPGRGTTVEILVPVTLSAMPTLSVMVGDEPALMPLDSVRRALRLAPGDVTRSDEGQGLVVDGTLVPFVPLGRVLRRSGRDTAAAASAVLLEAKGRLAAIGVDAVGGTRSVVVRAIPEHACAQPVVAGAALDDMGVPRLVLSAAALIQAASTTRGFTDQPEPSAPAPLLVIDDSLTSRMLEQSILESAGYQVDLAVSAEDGLHKAKKRRYAMFIVDVEMPGMSGFDFIATVRGDPDLGSIPAILVTSRADRDDKLRGKEVGARAYIVKSEFDQQELLETVRRLVE